MAPDPELVTRPEVEEILLVPDDGKDDEGEDTEEDEVEEEAGEEEVDEDDSDSDFFTGSGMVS